MVQWFIPILNNLDLTVSYAPTNIYKDIQPTIDIIKSNSLTIWVEYIAVHIYSVHEQYALITNDPANLKSTIQPDYISSKSLTEPLLETHYSYIYGA